MNKIICILLCVVTFGIIVFLPANREVQANPIDTNRQSAITELVKALGGYSSDVTILNSFFDAAEILVENRPYIAHAVQQGWIQGSAEGLLNPNGTITRAEIACLTCKILDLPLASGNAFSDLSDHWASGFIYALYNANIFFGYPDGTFKPDLFLTNVELTALCTKLGLVVDSISLYSGGQKLDSIPQTGGVYSVKAVYENNAPFTNTAYYILAVKSNNHILSINIIPFSFTANADHSFENLISLPSLAESPNLEIKAMLWTDMVSLRPIWLGYLSRGSVGGFVISGQDAL